MDAELIVLPKICEEGWHFRGRTCEAILFLISEKVLPLQETLLRKRRDLTALERRRKTRGEERSGQERRFAGPHLPVDGRLV
jgi:hypothetical protein